MCSKEISGSSGMAKGGKEMKIGLLPLYIALYDESSPECRPRMEAFYEEIAKQFEKRGVEVERTEDFCRLKPEFEEAVAKFEKENVDAIVTLHIAYSPSLESIEVLASSKLPIVVLDTTETLEFTNEQSSSEVMYNHGIHGVMDMCSMLKRYGKPYAIAAGHYEESKVIDEVCGLVRAAVAAGKLSKARVGLVGGAFDGMGDFAVDPDKLQGRFGIQVEDIDADVLMEYVAGISDEEIIAEIENDKKSFEFPEDIDWEEYARATAVSIGMRKCVEEKGLTAFSVNFRCVKEIPFLEACKAMQRGIGYAGEGDALTASFVGAFLQAYPETGFVEIFCPDWKNNLLFLSHMGEVNYRIVETKPLVRRANGLVNTFAGYARMKGGKGVYVNISLGKENYQLLVSSAEMVSYEHDNFSSRIRGWMKPEKGTTADFLKAHSEHGATHHSIFIYGATEDEMKFFGKLLGMDVVVI